MNSHSGRLIGYARVSTDDQNADLQVDALEAAGCERVFIDKASGAKKNRAALDEMLAYVRPGDTLVVWKLDRLGRSLRHLLEVVEDLEDRKVGFKAIDNAIDTTSGGGKLIFHIFGALAEFERELIAERTKAGLAATRDRGRVGGRVRKFDDDMVDAARAMYGNGKTVQSIADAFGVSRGTIYNYIGDLVKADSDTADAA